MKTNYELDADRCDGCPFLMLDWADWYCNIPSSHELVSEIDKEEQRSLVYRTDDCNATLGSGFYVVPQGVVDELEKAYAFYTERWTLNADLYGDGYANGLDFALNKIGATDD